MKQRSSRAANEGGSRCAGCGSYAHPDALRFWPKRWCLNCRNGRYETIPMRLHDKASELSLVPAARASLAQLVGGEQRARTLLETAVERRVFVSEEVKADALRYITILWTTLYPEAAKVEEDTHAPA